jgi:hypothetical protein
MSAPLLLRTTDIYVDSFTYTPSANTITLGQTESYPPQTVTINSFSGLSVTGKIGIGTTPSQASAILEVNSTSQGILPPRMSTTDRNNINLPAQGLILYNTTTDRLTYRDVNTWEEVVNVAEVSNNISPAVNLFNFYNFY